MITVVASERVPVRIRSKGERKEGRTKEVEVVDMSRSTMRWEVLNEGFGAA